MTANGPVKAVATAEVLMTQAKEKKPEAEKDPPYLAQLLKDHPGLTREKALEMIKEAGG